MADDRSRDMLLQLRQEFDAWADSYDQDVLKGHGVLQGYDRSRHLASRLVAPAAGMLVADIGIGTGAFADVFAAQGAAITGVDISPRMLALCGDRHPDWDLFLGDFLHLPLAKASQDLVVSSFAFHHLDDAERAAAVRECLRVLKPGGTFLLVDIMFRDQTQLRLARERLRDSWDEENYPTFPELRRLCRQLLVPIRLRTLSKVHGAAMIVSPYTPLR